MRPFHLNSTVDFPFRITFSLDPLIRFWRTAPVDDKQCIVSDYARRMREELDRAPDLAGPMQDLTPIRRHRELVDAMMTAIFPQASWESDIAAIVPPFDLRPVYSTPRFESMRLFADGKITGNVNIRAEEFLLGKVIRAYDFILRKFYDADLTLDYPVISSLPDPATGLDRHFHWRFETPFVDVHTVGPLKHLSAEDRKRLLSNAVDFRILYEILPPTGFEFYGFTFFQAVDVTEQEALSALRLALIQRDTLVSPGGFQELQRKLRELFRRPDLELGIASLPPDRRELMRFGRKIGNSFLLDESCKRECCHVGGSVYERALAGDLVIIDDLDTHPSVTVVERQIMKQGIRNLVLAPLVYQDQIVGLLELGSKNPGDLNAVNTLKLREILPLFAMATHRSIEEFNTKVQALIKEKFTSLHPSVEWRFENAARNHLLTSQTGGSADLEPIVFRDVYPLYGLTDIRGSSTQRNKAIEADLVEQLMLAREILRQARHVKDLPILAQLDHRIGKRIDRVAAGLNSGDETAVIEFLRNNIESLFEHLSAFDDSVRDTIRTYRDALDQELNVVYRMRRDFEESVSQVNDTITATLEEEEEAAQRMFPHYFEKYKTDGVEHTIYIGPSIAGTRTFDMLYLRNLRLWQLMVMCRVATRLELLKGRLRIPLETSHLILVQDTPMAIRFRVDEKKFDVDGSYNVRYEIMKKRIDKAVVQGRSERLTQPGTIAIVYSHAEEGAEYREYVDFLAARGLLAGEVESLELGEVQGVQGLKALRVHITMNGDAGVPMADQRLADAVKEMVRSVLKE
jgi:hypothetical protein